MSTNEPLDQLLQTGLTHIKQQAFTEAVASFTQAIELAPQDTRPYGYRAQLLAAMGKNKLALADCAKVLRLDPRQPDAWYLMGTLLQKQGDEAKAADCLRRAVEYGHTAVSPSPEPTPEPEPEPEPEPQASQRIDITVPPAPDMPLGELFDMALLALSHEQYRQAYIHFSQLLNRQPAATIAAEAYAYRGWACYKLGYVEDAHADLTLAVTQKNDSVEPYLQRGRVHLLEQEYPEAEDNFRHAAEHAPPYDVRPHLWLGQVALAQNKTEQAEHYLRRVLEIEPINSTAKELLSKLAPPAPLAMSSNENDATQAVVAPAQAKPEPPAHPLAVARETVGEFALLHGGDAEEIEVTQKRGLFNTKRITKKRINWRVRDEDTAVVLDLVPQPRASIIITPTEDGEQFNVRLVEPLSSGELHEVINTAVPLTQSALATWLYDLLEKGILTTDQGRLRYAK